MYGELCGKFYPGAADANEAKQWPGALGAERVNKDRACVVPQESRAVQEGIYYCDKLSFVVFDMAVVDVVDGKETMRFLDHDAVVEATAHAKKLKCLQPLVRGTYEQVKAFPYKSFDSTAGASLWGMPALPTKTNRAEGIVIKPTKTYMVTDHKGNPLRCLVKLKNPAFSDMSGEYADPTPTPGQLLARLVNANRVASLLSKHGDRVTAANLDQLVELMSDDVLQDFYARYPNGVGQSLDWDKDVAALAVKCREALARAIVV